MSNKLNQIKLTLCLFVILIVSTAALEVCYEEFFDESLGIFNNKYESDALFEVKKYEDFDDVDEPEDSNGYFISQADSGASSIVTGHGTNVPANTEITIAYYTINPGAAETVRWYVTSDTGTLIKSESFFVDDSKSWKYSTITVTRDSSILIRINCPDMSASGGFLAIDKITISTPTSDQCESFTAPDTTTTVTETSITPPTTVTPGTTVTQTSITPPTTVTPGTTVTETSITPPTTVTPGTTVTETTITPPTTDSTITTAKLTTITPPIETTTGTTPATTQKQTTHVTTPASTTETETPPTSETTGSSIDTTPIPEQPPWDDSELEKWKTISIVSLTIASVEFVYAIGITAYIVINKRLQNQYEMD